MGTDIERSRQDLALLPSSGEKNEALRLLAEIEKSEAEEKVLLENLERTLEKCRLTDDERSFYRWFPWFSAVLGFIAIYGGIEAITTQEFCASSRGSWSCSHGLKAQMQGIATLLIGFLLLLLPLPGSRWRTLGVWVFGLSLVLAFFGGILVQ